MWVCSQVCIVYIYIISLYSWHNKTTDNSGSLLSFSWIKKANACLFVCLLLCKYLSRNHSEWVQTSRHESIPPCALPETTVESVLNIYSESRLFHRNQTQSLHTHAHTQSALIHLMKPSEHLQLYSVFTKTQHSFSLLIIHLTKSSLMKPHLLLFNIISQENMVFVYEYLSYESCKMYNLGLGHD